MPNRLDSLAPEPTPHPEEPIVYAQAPATSPANALRTENREKSRLWALDHPRRRPQGHDRETWLAAVKGWLTGL